MHTSPATADATKAFRELRQFRLDADLTFDTLASLVGVTKHTIYDNLRAIREGRPINAHERTITKVRTFLKEDAPKILVERRREQRARKAAARKAARKAAA